MCAFNNTTERKFTDGQVNISHLENVPTVYGVIMLVVFLCASVLSPSVLWALWKTKQLRFPVYRLIAYLLMNEVLVRIFGSPLVVISMLARQWLFGDFGCVFYGFWMTWLGVTATSLFTCIAVERYAVMCRAETTHKFTTKSIDLMSLTCYIHGLIWACLPFVGINKYVYEPSGISCTPSWSPDNKGYILGLFAVCFVIPVVVSLFCYSSIFHMVRHSIHETTVARVNADTEKKLALTLILTMAAFLFAWTPYAVAGLHTTLGFEKKVHMDKQLNLIVLVAAKSAGLWNPLIFSIHNREARTIIAKTVCRARECFKSDLKCWRWKQVPTESSSE